MKFRVEIATILPCVFIAMLMFTGSCTREPMVDVDKWRAVHDTTLTPESRWQLLSDLLSGSQFKRARVSSTIELLGPPDHQTSDTLSYSIIEGYRYGNDSMLTMRLIFKFSEDSLIKTTTILKKMDYVVPNP